MYRLRMVALRLALLALLLGAVLLAHADEPSVEPLPAEAPSNAIDPDNLVPTALAAIEREALVIQTLFEELERAPEWDRDAFRFRIDQRLRNLLERINRFALELATSELDYDVRAQQSDRLIAHVDWTLDSIMMRVRQIDERIGAAREALSEIEHSTAGAMTEAFIQEQTRMRFAYAHALIDHLEARRRLQARPALAQLQLSSEDIQLRVERTVTRYAERLVGQVRLDAQTLVELRNRRAEDPLNTDLERAQQTVRRRQSRSLSNLEAVIEMLNRLDMDATEQRSVLLQQRGLIGVELLERQVFFTILREQFERLQRTLVRSGPNFLFRTVVFLIALGLTLLIARLVRKTVRALTDAVKFNRLAAAVLVSISWLAVVIAGLVLALGTLGISIAPLLAGFGVAGLILGLAMQSTLSNLACGAMILLYRPYDVDDHIQIAGASGQVKKMNLVATTINTFDNQVLVVPNNKIWGDIITNFTASKVRRVDVEASFGYAEDMDKVERILRDILEQHEMVLPKPAPDVHIGAMKDSCVTMMLKGWVRTENYWPTLRSLTREVKRRFDAEGISIPYPQRDVHIYSAGAPSTGAASEEPNDPRQT